MTPTQLASLGLRLLKEKSDPVRAKGAKKYFKEEVKCLGLTAAQQRELALNVYLMIKNDWTVKEAIEFCEVMLQEPYLEARGLGIFILDRFKKDFPESLFSKIKGWLARDFCDNWALVDSLCPGSVAALLEKYPGLVTSIKTWAHSSNRWIRRASAVSFITLARKGQYLDDVYEIAGSLFSDSDDLVQKATGWLLREAGKADMKRLEKFLLSRGALIPRTTLRYAIERFEEKKRTSILKATKQR
jgi:3-methyladenine DNA glycosylase AlkD